MLDISKSVEYITISSSSKGWWTDNPSILMLLDVITLDTIGPQVEYAWTFNSNELMS